MRVAINATEFRQQWAFVKDIASVHIQFTAGTRVTPMVAYNDFNLLVAMLHLPEDAAANEDVQIQGKHLEAVEAWVRQVDDETFTMVTDSPEFVGFVSGTLRLMVPRGTKPAPPWVERTKSVNDHLPFLGVSGLFLSEAAGRMLGEKIRVRWPGKGEPLRLSDMTGDRAVYIMPLITVLQNDLNGSQTDATPPSPAAEPLKPDPVDVADNVIPE